MLVLSRCKTIADLFTSGLRGHILRSPIGSGAAQVVTKSGHLSMNSPQRPQVVLRYHSSCVPREEGEWGLLPHFPPLADFLTEQILKTHCKIQVLLIEIRMSSIHLARGDWLCLAPSASRLSDASPLPTYFVRQGHRRAIRMP